jgi:hypothetical protein
MPVMQMFTLILALAVQSTTTGFTPDQLWRDWSDERFVQTPAPCLRPAELTADLRKLAATYPAGVRLEEIGQSFGGRPIHMVTLGHGQRTVLLWSQMHGDEPSATPALLDIAHYLLSRADEPAAAAILDNLTLLMIPMLNPDGSANYERTNLQAIDINRDALLLTTPEGQTLKRVRDEYEPILGFNLHDQDRRIAVGDTGVLATTSLLAVSGDAEGTLTPGRARAKRTCSAIAVTLEQFIPGGVARFNEDWNPRAFGDNITSWGTPVVLIESGGPPPGRDFGDLTRLNFVAVLTVLQGLVRDDLDDYDPAVYDDLPRNQRDAWADVVVLGGSVQQPRNGPAYRADLAFNIDVDDRDLAGCATGVVPRSFIADIGDARFLGAGRVVDAGESLVAVPFAAGVDGWKARRWLSAEVLSEVARLGVGTVFWRVSHRKADAAKALAGGFAGAGRARLVVVQTQAEMPWLTLDGPPGRAKSDLLPDVIEALVGANGGTRGTAPSSLDQLCWVPDSETRQPVLRRGRPASFVQLAPAIDGEIDFAKTHLAAVFINGLEVKGDAR